MTDPEFLDLADVLPIHEEQLARYGGSAGLRDQGLLESAIGMPQASFRRRVRPRAPLRHRRCVRLPYRLLQCWSKPTR